MTKKRNVVRQYQWWVECSLCGASTGECEGCSVEAAIAAALVKADLLGMVVVPKLETNTRLRAERVLCAECLNDIIKMHGRKSVLETLRAKVLQAVLDYQHHGMPAGKAFEELSNALAESREESGRAVHADGPTTHDRPTGVGNVDIVCNGCGEAVAGPHSWAECCAAQRKRVESLCGDLAKMEDERDDARSNRRATQEKLEAMTALWHLELKASLAIKIERDDAIRARDAALDKAERFKGEPVATKSVDAND